MTALAVPVLRTPRLTLRGFTQGDLDDYAAICADGEVMQYIGAGGAIDRDAAWRQMALFMGQWALRGHGTWAVARRSDGRLVGRVGFLQPEGWPGIELAWTLAREGWGQGLAHEAARAALSYGRDALGIDAPISLIRPDNRRSIALAERLGAVADGCLEFMGASSLLYRHRAPVR